MLWPVWPWIQTDSIWCLAVSVAHTRALPVWFFVSYVMTTVMYLSQVTTAPCVSGTWRARRVFRSSPLTGRSSTSPSTTWRFTPPSATSAAREQTPSPKCSYDLWPLTKTASTESWGGSEAWTLSSKRDVNEGCVIGLRFCRNEWWCLRK